MTEFSPLSDQSLPPQNIEAEESILGGILLDPEAIARVAEILPAEAFYLQGHQTIYQGAIALQTQGKPTDLMNLSTWLADQELLDKVGGKAKLAQLADRTVSAVNIDGYAQLVLDKYLRRQLINAGHKIVQFGYDTTEALNTILDRAEQSIFAITQERPQSGLVPLSETLIETYDQIEGLYYQDQLPGLKSSFYDLDSMTSGLQPSDLIILAGRPSMGKTAFGLNIARNIAGTYHSPVALFSLEMSKEQLSQRLLASEAKIESNRLRSGRLSQQDYQKLSSAIGTLSEVPIFIDDTATLTVMEMRSQARRLQAEHGQLGLVLLDYLQLMEGGGDNRVQELSRITRSLKTLARELKTPVIALSQLSRGVEQRTNKRPMLSDLRESGSIEQDADLVLMLYRDAYYNPDTPDRDLAELIITKHRNGPTGTVKLIFNAELTEFRNMARYDNESDL
ncbi:MAG: replicative DNA helicase [Cyanobacteria bacterium]|jgi:replicative DNA helicase|nr:replicative DNA helicase [Cyanobacteria bacterium GSL.Bin21]